MERMAGNLRGVVAYEAMRLGFSLYLECHGLDMKRFQGWIFMFWTFSIPSLHWPTWTNGTFPSGITYLVSYSYSKRMWLFTSFLPFQSALHLD